MTKHVYLFDCLLHVMNEVGLPSHCWTLTLQSFDANGDYAAARALKWAGEISQETGKAWMVVAFGPSGSIDDSIAASGAALPRYFEDLLSIQAWADQIAALPQTELGE